MGLLFETSDLWERIEDIKCPNCGHDIEIGEWVTQTVEDIYEEYGYDGLFGEDGFLTEIPETDCGVCYHYTQIPQKDFDLLIKETKELLEQL